MTKYAKLSPPQIASLSDDELREFETCLPFPNKDNKRFIPPFPEAVLLEIVKADAVAALPLVLAIHRQLTMKKTNETPLNEAIWKVAGNPSVKKRALILRKLKSLPQFVELIPARTALYYYRVKRGSIWDGNS